MAWAGMIDVGYGPLCAEDSERTGPSKTMDNKLSSSRTLRTARF